jgi:hypothetical protein
VFAHRGHPVGVAIERKLLLSFIEWEDFGHNWKIDTLEPSESLPQGAEKAEVWRNEDYELKAKVSER